MKMWVVWSEMREPQKTVEVCIHGVYTTKDLACQAAWDEKRKNLSLYHSTGAVEVDVDKGVAE